MKHIICARIPDLSKETHREIR